MKGIEAATSGTICGEIELKTSKNGTPYLSLSLAVDVGNDDGKPQWVRVACFGDTAKAIASRAKKGDRVYCEGSLTMTQWNDAYGEVKHGLNVAAWKAELIGASAIGKNRKRQVENYGANSYKPPRQAIGSAFQAKAAELEPHRREKPKIQGLNDEFEFNDRLPW
jgi:single-stranded DNA-binding protein